MQVRCETTRRNDSVSEGGLAVRIIGGALGGRRIAAPKGAKTRPTSERVREALFSILAPTLADGDALSCLDLFAGTGALGLEALSRGIGRAVFVDSSRDATRVLRKNVSALQLGDRSVVVCARLPEGLARAQREVDEFDLVFIDPPYATDLGTLTLGELGAGATLGRAATVVLEHDRRRPSPLEVGCLVRTDQRRYGDTELSFYQRRDRP